MISILKNSFTFLVVLLSFVCFGSHTYAQTNQSQTLSVSPTLFQMSANPSQTWSSEIRVINVNDYEITVYPQVVNFAPSGENGQGTLVPVFSEETQGQTLAEWVQVTKNAVTIAPQQTLSIPFTVTVTKDAAPGGHYAAILVGTKPPEKTGGSSLVQTAQFVTSLLFVRVSGDVIERGNIREFTTTDTVNNEPNVQFDVRFENTGNVHLQPQGDIVITNMWGTQRGVIPINYQTHFGNVLPNSVRKFSFTWTGGQSSYDIGRFKAIATLGYGADTKSFTTSTTYFWIIPVQQILFITIGLLLVLWFFTFAIKMYIKRMLVLAGLEPNQLSQQGNKKNTLYSSQATVPTKTVIVRRYQTVTAPVRLSIRELLQNLKAAPRAVDSARVISYFVVRYRLFILSAALLGLLIVVGVWFFGEHNTQSRLYDVGIVNPDATIVISSDEILYRSLPLYELPAGAYSVEPPPFTIEIINASGEPGAGAYLRRKLEAYGYTVTALSNELNRFDVKSVIIFAEKNKDAALELSKHVNSALLSTDSAITDSVVKIYVGSDSR